MAEGLQRQLLQKISEARIIDAQVLLASDRFSGAYYLAGYSVEIGLKACIARRMMAETIPDRSLINAIYSHGFKHLVGVAGLTADLQSEQQSNSLFAEYWSIAGGWGPEARYALVESYSAQIFVQAVSDPDAGILRWIRQYW